MILLSSISPAGLSGSAGLLVFCFIKRGNISRDGLAEIMDKAHSDHLVDVQLGVFVGAKQSHHRKPPGMLRHAFLRSRGGPGVAGVAFQLFNGIQKRDICTVIHGVPFQISLDKIRPLCYNLGMAMFACRNFARRDSRNEWRLLPFFEGRNLLPPDRREVI